MTREIELKLSIPEERSRDVWQSLAHLDHDRPVARTLYSAYYDTPDERLRQHGLALRLRRDGRRWMQTLKGGGSATGGLHQRIEHDARVPAQRLNFSALAEAGIGALIADHEVRGSLSIAFITEFRRSSALLRLAGGDTVEVSIDNGEIVAGRRRVPISEIELELKSGSPACLFELAAQIAQQLPARLDNRSKAQRGYALAAGLTAAPVKAVEVALDPAMRPDEAFALLAFGCIGQLQGNESGLLAGRDPEYLHQARVALRRLRSLARLFRPVTTTAIPDASIAELRSLCRQLGTARDWDVFVTETLPAVAGNAARHPGLAALRRRAQAQRRQASAQVRATVADPGYTLAMLRLVASLSADSAGDGTIEAATLRTFASTALARQHAKVLKRGRNLDHLGFAELHRLRIEVKRLRYAVEFFLPLAPKKAREMLRALAELQGLLGRINDAASAWTLLDQLAGASSDAAYQQAVGYVRGWSAGGADACLARLPDAWTRFRQARTWW
jgi:inorganic triphosphatase YgiF